MQWVAESVALVYSVGYPPSELAAPVEPICIHQEQWNVRETPGLYYAYILDMSNFYI